MNLMDADTGTGSDQPEVPFHLAIVVKGSARGTGGALKLASDIATSITESVKDGCRQDSLGEAEVLTAQIDVGDEPTGQ